jgi:hypothetical protein
MGLWVKLALEHIIHYLIAPKEYPKVGFYHSRLPAEYFMA